MHRFLESCANGFERKILTGKLDFTGMLEVVEEREFVTKILGWISRLSKKREAFKGPSSFRVPQDANRGDRGGGGGGPDNKKRRQFSSQGQAKRYQNRAEPKKFRLTPNEQFRGIFHPRDLRGLSKFMRNNELLCLRFHTLGFCYQDCKYKTGHGELSTDEEFNTI